MAVMQWPTFREAPYARQVTALAIAPLSDMTPCPSSTLDLPNHLDDLGAMAAGMTAICGGSHKSPGAGRVPIHGRRCG